MNFARLGARLRSRSPLAACGGAGAQSSLRIFQTQLRRSRLTALRGLGQSKSSKSLQQQAPTCRAQATSGKHAKASKVAMKENASNRSGKLGNVLLILALTGASTGTFLDGIHSRVQLLIYDSAPLTIGGLHTSAWVPPLLAAFYFVLGGAVLFMDYRMAPSDPVTREAMRHASLSKMALSFAALAAMLELSAVLYSNDVPSNTICLALAACAAVNYLIFDSTKQGMAFAVLCAVGAPVAELVLMQSVGLWHYPHGDLAAAIAGGLPKWVPFCYFFYVPAVANYARFLWKIM